jgi:hypothetical protein
VNKIKAGGPPPQDITPPPNFVEPQGDHQFGQVAEYCAWALLGMAVLGLLAFAVGIYVGVKG